MLDVVEKFRGAHSFPKIPEARPTSDAVEIRKHPDSWQGLKLLPGPSHRRINQPFDLERPFIQSNLGRPGRVQHRPFAGACLAWRNAILAKRIRADDDIALQSLRCRCIARLEF